MSATRPRAVPPGFEWLDPAWEVELSVVRGDTSAGVAEAHMVIPTVQALRAHLRRGTLVLVAVYGLDGEEIFTIEPTGRFAANLADLSWWLEEAQVLWESDAAGSWTLPDGTRITM